MTSVQVTPSHLARQAAIYVRQSTVEQVRHNLESQRRQYGLVDRAVNLGWPRPQVMVIDDDLGVSGGGGPRVGFERLVADVGLGHIGIVLAIEVSRLARNNRDWYHLLDLCALVDTLIGDGDGLYHPGVFNDRLLFGPQRDDERGGAAPDPVSPGRRVVGGSSTWCPANSPASWLCVRP